MLKATELIKGILAQLGEDPSRDGLKNTPLRVVKSWKELYGGYSQKPEDVLTVFEKGTYDQIVVLKHIEFYSTCEHHMLPFSGVAHIGYLPGDKVIGISKLARLLEIYARRLQIQERIGEQVTEALMIHLKALGAGCIIDAKHSCIQCRGIQKQNSVMTTSSVKGIFKEDPTVKQEFIDLIRL
jgi:GTP cyclohydrolase I